LIFANKFSLPLRYICIKGKQMDKKSQLLFCVPWPKMGGVAKKRQGRIPLWCPNMQWIMSGVYKKWMREEILLGISLRSQVVASITLPMMLISGKHMFAVQWQCNMFMVQKIIHHNRPYCFDLGWMIESLILHDTLVVIVINFHCPMTSWMHMKF
jgi:hypothetical protein